jgi:hypothetical protein
MGTGSRRPTCHHGICRSASVSVDFAILFAECLINESSCSLADSPDLDQQL